MKQLLYLCFILSLLLCPLYSQGQRKHEKYRYKSGAVYFKFLKNHKFLQYVYCAGPRPCGDGISISEGNFKRKGDSFILNTYKNFITPFDPLSVEIQYSSVNNDTLYIALESPYESLLEQEELSRLCTFMHDRIYQYSVSIVCDTDSLNKEFEAAFNIAHIADTCNQIVSPLPSGVRIFQIEINISWIPDKAENTSSSSASVPIFSQSCENNHIIITIPCLTYSYLFHKKYVNAKAVILDKNKSISVEGRTFQRIIRKSYARMRREEKQRLKDLFKSNLEHSEYEN